MLIDPLLLIENHFQHPSSCEAYGEELYQNCNKIKILRNNDYTKS